MVTQENILFHDTVFNNISYGLGNINKDRVISAAQAALAHDFIQELPLRYDTVIGERGTRLSGQKTQHVAFPYRKRHVSATRCACGPVRGGSVPALKDAAALRR